MEPAPLESRRATIEDLGALEILWSQSGLPATELGKFLTEFHVVTDSEGQILHAIGLLVEGDQALLHSEALSVPLPVEPDVCRAAVWRRLRILARNQGISRIWTQEDAEYWRVSGYQAIPESQLPPELPSFVQREAGWWMHQSPDTAQADLMVQREFALWKTQREQESQSFQQRVKAFRAVALGLFGLSLILLLGFLFYAAKLRPDAFRNFFR
jgi:N-acetylglutamate synthase-like GNAT family acetyltransferase